MNRLAAAALRWAILLAIIAYLPVWALALSLTGGEYLGRLGAAAWTNYVLLAIRELTPILVITLALAANPSLLREKFSSPLGWCLAVLFAGVVVFMLRRPAYSLLPAAVVLARFSVFFIMPFAVRSIVTHTNARIRRSIARTVLAVLVFNLFLCCVQTRLMDAFEGSGILGPRTVGMTNNPNTAGSLLALAPLLMFAPAAGHRVWMLLLSAACFLGALTTGSRAAMGGLAVLLMFLVPRAFPKARIPMLIGGLILVAVVGASLNRLSGRYEQLRGRPESPRLRIARTALQDASLSEMILGRGIGVGTNTFVTLYGLEHPLGIIADSLFTSWFMQFGFLGLALLLANTYYLFRGFGPEGVFFFLFFCLFSITQNLVEVYPTSFLLMVIAGIHGARRRDYPHEPSSQLYDLV